jgi:hypothetical protein
MGNEIPEIDIDTSSDLGQLIQFHMPVRLVHYLIKRK